jgi:hypothetical protein
VNRGRIPYDYKESKMHHTPSNQETEIEGIIFYSEGEGKQDKAPGFVDNIKDKKLQSEGLIRINVGQIIEQTDLSCPDPSHVAN